MAPINDDDPFLGAWELLPESSEYELGDPPAEGLYTISSDGDRYHFEIAWKTAAGRHFETGFSGIPDGRPYAYEDPQVADALSLTRVDESTLDSESFRGEVRLAHARRVLMEDGRMMRVSQSGQAPDGETFQNISYYRKL